MPSSKFARRMNPRKAPAVCHAPPPAVPIPLPPPYATACRAYVDWYKHMGFPTTNGQAIKRVTNDLDPPPIGATIVTFCELFTVPHDYAANWFVNYPPSPYKPRAVIQLGYHPTTNRFRLQAWLMITGPMPYEYVDFADRIPKVSHPLDTGWLFRGGPKPASSVTIRIQQTPH